MRITNSITGSTFSAGINLQRNKLNVLQEQISTNKRINRPSDSPGDAETVLNLKTSQTAIEQFKRNAATVYQKLTVADDTLNNYETILNRVQTLVSQGLSDTTTSPTAKNSLATELETLRQSVLNIANTKQDNHYVFGGTRQNEAPFDPSTATPATLPATSQYVQIEPGASPIRAGVTAESFLSDANSTIFTDLTSAIDALRGTGDAVADKATLKNTISRVHIYTDLAANAHAVIGANTNTAETVQDELLTSSTTLGERISSLEDIDFAETALQLKDAQNSLEASLQVAATGRRSLFDYLG
jgi:flagellar hook-associated protein 3 FlgL